MDNINRYLYTQRLGELEVEQSSFRDHWQDISRHLLPRSGRFFTTDRNKGQKKHHDIYDSTATRALRILSAGLMSGMSSPARPWFRLAVSDKALMKRHSVRAWLHGTEETMRSIMAKSNFYRMLQSMYEELPAFGTAAAILEPNFDNVMHGHFLTIGQYCIAQNNLEQVDTLYRKFDMTCGQLMKQFGYENCSQSVKTLIDRGSFEKWVTVVHLIEPRIDRDPTLRDKKNMAYKSVYYELGRENEMVLSESGFKRFRAIVPRWHISGGDIYGSSCPGMEALGDIRQLQHEQLRKGQAIDYKLRPPLQGPTSMKNNEPGIFPGEMTFVDTASSSPGVRTLYEVNLDLSHLLADIQDVRQRINSAFYADLFLMFAQQDITRMTATEVAQRQEEKLLMLGPVMERIQNELHAQAIEIIFDDMMDAGLVEAPPQELQGMDLNIEFVSMMAQAQKAVGINSIDRFLGTIGAIAPLKPSIVDKLDEDALVDMYSDRLGIDPALIVASEKVAIVRDQRARQAQQMQQAEMANQSADAMQKMSNVSTEPGNVVGDVMNMFSGYSTGGR